MKNTILKKVTKSFGSVNVIKGVDLEIQEGEFTVFVGPSGCGKSTLLRLIAGLEETTSGTLEIAGVDVTNLEPAERGVAMVFQSYALYPHMSVEENMGFGLKMNGMSKAEIKDRVSKAAEILQLGPLLSRKPKQLSGGQRQRVAIGRCIVREPKLFLFDEPLSNLDAELRVEMRLEIAKLHKQLGASMVYVTHDQVEAMTLADKIVVLRAGLIEQVGSPLTLYHDPDNIFVAGFIGSPKMNLLDAKVIDVNDKAVHVTLDSQPNTVIIMPLTEQKPAKGTEVILGIRPEHFTKEGDNELSTTIEVIEKLGSISYGYSNDIGKMIFQLPADAETKEGDAITLKYASKQAFLFNKESGLRLR